MKRLPPDQPNANFETMLNFVYGKDGWAHIRHDGENADVPLTEWARKQCLSHKCDEFPSGTLMEIDLEISDCMMDYPGCPIALAYCFASQAVHMRDRLKMYEDILFAEDGTERVSLDQLRTMAVPQDNPLLTTEELWRMDGEPVWNDTIHRWMLVDSLNFFPKTISSSGKWRGLDDRYYRRKPEEGTT